MECSFILRPVLTANQNKGTKNLNLVNFIPVMPSSYAPFWQMISLRVSCTHASSRVGECGQASLPFSILVAHRQTTLPLSVLLRYDTPQSPHTSKFPRRYLPLYLLTTISTAPSSLLTNFERLAISSCVLSNTSAVTMAG